jgi:GNAT superfamily N-acetyltransferase
LQQIRAMLTIVPYESRYAKNFKELNIEWIAEYFEVENRDIELLENSKSSIIDRDGYIFMGLWDHEPVGCFALIKKSSKKYELGKMAVKKTHHGLHIGQNLLSFAIEFSIDKRWKKLVLYSSTKLDTALHIYKKYGFKEVPLEDNLEYLRSDIKMELTL